MIEFLETDYGLSKVDAYMLCSVAGDLRMHEVVSLPALDASELLNSPADDSGICDKVDMPNYVVSADIRKSVVDGTDWNTS